MKTSQKILLLVICLFISSNILAWADTTGSETQKVELEGILRWNNSGAGFYTLAGCKLMGDMPLDAYIGKGVALSGEADTFYSTSVRKAVWVKSIKEKPIQDMKNAIKAEITNLQAQLKEADTQKLCDLQEKMILQMEKAIAIEGEKAPLSDYKALGVWFGQRGEKEIHTYINGEKLLMEQGMSILSEKGRILIPFEALAEALGTQVYKDEAGGKIILRKGETRIKLYTVNKTVKGKAISSKVAYVNNKAINLEVPPKMVNGTTYIPLRFIAEALKAQVQWIGEGRIIVVSCPQSPKLPDMKAADFAITYKGCTLAPGAWDKDIPLSQTLGKPRSEKVERLGTGADTYAGSYVKTQVYSGLTLILGSPKDNGKTFAIQKITVTDSRYVTGRGIKVGDSYKKLLTQYPYKTQEHMLEYDDANHVYRIGGNGTYFIEFDVSKGVIKSITLYNELP